MSAKLWVPPKDGTVTFGSMKASIQFVIDRVAEDTGQKLYTESDLNRERAQAYDKCSQYAQSHSGRYMRRIAMIFHTWATDARKALEAESLPLPASSELVRMMGEARLQEAEQWLMSEGLDKNARLTWKRKRLAELTAPPTTGTAASQVSEVES